jgi:hypothetical protein
VYSGIVTHIEQVTAGIHKLMPFGNLPALP